MFLTLYCYFREGVNTHLNECFLSVYAACRKEGTHRNVRPAEPLQISGKLRYCKSFPLYCVCILMHIQSRIPPVYLQPGPLMCAEPAHLYSRPLSPESLAQHSVILCILTLGMAKGILSLVLGCSVASSP